MDKEIKRLMQSFFGSETQSYAKSCWCPHADIYRGKQGWLVKFDLAGVKAEDVRLQISGSQLTVSGTRRDYVIMEEQRAHSMEIAYNRFERSIELPCSLAECELSSEYRDGMYLVLIRPRRNPS